MSLGILITYYNEKELLTRTLRAIYADKFPPEEVLVYDDCSDEPAEKFVPPHLKELVQVVRGRKNLGPAKGRNLLLQRSSADYIKFHDTDDELKPGWSEAIRSSITRENPDVILFEVDSVKPGPSVTKQVIGLAEISSGRDPVAFAVQHAIVTSSAVYRREYLKVTGPYREDLWQSEDHEFHMRVLSYKPALAIIADSLLLLHVRNESRSQKLLEVWQCRLQGLKYAYDYLQPKYRQDLSDAAAEVGSILFDLGDEPGAKSAFDWAFTVGKPQFLKRPYFYRRLARTNPVFAEKVGKVYRAFIPSFLRRLR